MSSSRKGAKTLWRLTIWKFKNFKFSAKLILTVKGASEMPVKETTKISCLSCKLRWSWPSRSAKLRCERVLMSETRAISRATTVSFKRLTR